LGTVIDLGRAMRSAITIAGIQGLAIGSRRISGLDGVDDRARPLLPRGGGSSGCRPAGDHGTIDESAPSPEVATADMIAVAALIGVRALLDRRVSTAESLAASPQRQRVPPT
jgi:hypothetical protein